LRKARKKRRSAARAARRALHFEKMMAQEKTEKIKRIAKTAIVRGPPLPIISKISICSRNAGASGVKPSPNFQIYHTDACRAVKDRWNAPMLWIALEIDLNAICGFPISALHCSQFWLRRRFVRRGSGREWRASTSHPWQANRCGAMKTGGN